ncbi:MAG: glycosyltransferase family 4 protein [Herpetosiphon sp.]|nr:glycosyltransferase family 4 protein [Herpetosiphon sp.]
MRLLYVTTSYNAALLDRVHEEFLLRLIEQGHEATILVPDPSRDRTERWQIEHGAIDVVRPAVSMTRLDRILNRISIALTEYSHFLTFLRTYLQYLRQHPEFDIIHVESVYPLGAVAAIASWFDRRPFVPTIRGGDLIADDAIGYGFARFKRVRWLLKLVFARSAAIRAVSPMAARMAIQFGCPEAKIITIGRNIRDEYFERDTAAFRMTSRATIRERYAQINGRKVIVAAGRLLPVKGFDDLIKAMAALPDTIALICGPNRIDETIGDYGAYLANLTQEKGVQDRVIFTGGIPREEMAMYFASADVLAVPSLIEGGNRTVLEGAALGVPFVASDTAGTPDFFQPNEGIAVPPQRPDLLAAALATILHETAEQWAQRSAACEQRAQQFYSPQVATTVVRAYQAIIARLSAKSQQSLI